MKQSVITDYNCSYIKFDTWQEDQCRDTFLNAIYKEYIFCDLKQSVLDIQYMAAFIFLLRVKFDTHYQLYFPFPLRQLRYLLLVLETNRN